VPTYAISVVIGSGGFGEFGEFRRNRDDMIEVYKILMGKYDPTLPSILHRNTNSTTRGNPLKLCTYCPK